MAICAAKASSTSRDGRHMRQEAVVLGAATASSTARRCGDWRCEDVIHDKMVHGDRRCADVGCVATDSMRDGGRQREEDGGHAVPLGGDGSAKLPQEDNGVMPLRGDNGGAMPSSQGELV